MFKPQITHFIYPKFGNSFVECEDNYFFYPKHPSTKTRVFRVAVADGATESSFSKEWSDILTCSFRSFSIPLKVSFLDQLPSLRNFWRMEAYKNPLPWYAEEKVSKGAFSTFLGVLFDLENRQFECLAIGDCCLFQIREDELITKFPLESSDNFSNTPYLVSSNPSDNQDLSDFLLDFKGALERGDVFYMMSDALANWFLHKAEKIEKPWLILGESLKGGKKRNPKDSKIVDLINDQRQKKSLKNDDIAIVHLEMQ
jgi:hypothetical protein